MRWFFTITLLCTTTAVLSQARLDTYTFQEVDSLSIEEPRPVFVFIHADWCTICHRMEATTLADSAVVKLLNSAYYFVSLDGESRESVTYQGVKYLYEPTGLDVGTHQLAQVLGEVDGELNYPTLCVLHNNTDIVFKHGGALNKPDLLKILKAGVQNQGSISH